MRTTINIDDDLLSAVRERAHSERRTIGEVTSDLIRDALTKREHAYTMRNGFPQLPSRGGVVTSELINSIRDEIGDE